jgi:hypothetical protein
MKNPFALKVMHFECLERFQFFGVNTEEMRSNCEAKSRIGMRFHVVDEYVQRVWVHQIVTVHILHIFPCSIG